MLSREQLNIFLFNDCDDIGNLLAGAQLELNDAEGQMMIKSKVNFAPRKHQNNI